VSTKYLVISAINLYKVNQRQNWFTKSRTRRCM